jgi:hypothetical protein
VSIRRDGSKGHRLLLLTASAFLIAGCGLFGPVEQIRQEPSKTVYRSPEPASAEEASLEVPKRKVPGE